MNTFRVTLLFILILVSLPFEFYNFIPGIRKYVMLLVHAVMAIDIIRNGRFQVSHFNLIFLIIGLIAFSILYAYHQYSLYISYMVQFVAVFLVLVYIDTFKLFEKYIKGYITILTITGIGGIIGFLIALMGIDPMMEVQTPQRLLYFYYTTLTPTYMSFGSFNLIRFSGFFDEPGKFAYFHLFGLYYLYLNQYNRKFLIFFALIGLFTTSLAYIVSVIAAFGFYLLYSYRVSLKKIIIIALTGLFLISIFNLDKIYPSDITTNLNWFVSSRLSFDKSRFSDDRRLFIGDNRTGYMMYSYEVFKENPIFGYDKNDTKYVRDAMIANIFAYFAQHGLIGVSALYFMFGYLIFYILSRDHKITIYIILFLILINFYQRPYFSSGYMGYLLIPTLIYSIKYYHLPNRDDEDSTELENNQVVSLK